MSLNCMYTLSQLFWGVSKHLAAGYLLYSLLLRACERRPLPLPTAALLIGSLFPDLIDKPLTFVGVLSYGRSFAHSLFTMVTVTALILYAIRRSEQQVIGYAFILGYFSHILVDMYGEVTGGATYIDTAFLLWPVVIKYQLGIASPDVPSGRAIFAGIMLAAALLWFFDGLFAVPRWIQAVDKFKK